VPGSRTRLLAGAPAVMVAILALAGLTKAHSNAACASAPIAGSHPLQIAVDGTQRTALVHVPPAAPAGRRLPLVLALHGYGSSGPQMEPYSGFSAVADREGFLVAYPSSSGIYWNSTAAPHQADDIRFIRTLIDQLEQTMCVDPQRVFAVGVSNGGSMVAMAGCELSTRISAIASVEGDYSRQRTCRPAQPVSVLEIHGTADQIVPYFGRAARRTADGLPPFVNGWVARDECSSRPRTGQLASRAKWFAWSGCAAGVRVEHIRVSGGRHQWPGASPPDPGPPSTFCGACTIWRFFSGVRDVTRSWRHAKQRAG
jgi:polyhydroxybutyrate depolymerase